MKYRIGSLGLMAITLGCAALPQTGHAANWVQLQAVSPPTYPKAKLSGFAQPLFSSTNGTKAINNAVPNENLIGPNLNSNQMFNVLRARLMLRGYVNQYFSYFISGEFGNNAYTDPGTGYSPRLQDFHGTLSYIPGVRLQAGIIRAPGPEEAMQGEMGYEFNAYTTVIQQLMFQSFFTPSPAHKYVPFSGGYLVPVDNVEGTNAFRYSGIAAMDWFRRGNWEFTYDAMVGSFAPPTSPGSFGDAPIFAARLQESYIIGGNGPFRGDVTGFAWYQYARPIFNDRLYNFHREGFGVTYMQGYMHQGGHWFKAEYMQGSGLIEAPAAFGLSPETYAAPNLYQAQVYPGIGNRAYGYYAGVGYFVLPKLEIDERYDYYNRLPNNDVQNRVFSTWTTGVQYHVTPLMRLVLNYGVRDANAPHLSAIPAKTRPIAKSVTNSIDNVFSAEFVVAF